MNKNKAPEFDPELLQSVPPEKRDIFKRTVRKKRYLGSGLFFFIWHLVLWQLSYPILLFVFKLIPLLEYSLEPLFGEFTGLIFSFFMAIIFGFLTKRIRFNLNQTGIHVTHAFFIGLPLIYLAWYWIVTSPERGY